MKKTKILFIEFCQIGGPPNQLLSLIQYLHKTHPNAYELTVIASPNSVIARAITTHQFTFVPLVSYESMYLPGRMISSLIRYCKTLCSIAAIAIKQHPDIIHANHHMWSIYAIPMGFLTGKPVIVHLRDIWLLQPKVARILMKMYPKTIYISISSFVRKIFITRYKLSSKKVITIYDGFNTKTFKPTSLKRIKQKQGGSNKQITMMSRIEQTRNIETFIDAAAILLATYPSLIFIHYGYSKVSINFQYYHKLKARVQALGIKNNFFFRPYIDNPHMVAKVLSSSYLSVVPAKQFALSNTAIESMLCATPVIALATGGNLEIVSNSSYGTLIPVHSPILIAKAIETYFVNTPKYISTALAAATRVKQKFGWKKQFSQIDSLYQTLC